jgi:hypothetical protein
MTRLAPAAFGDLLEDLDDGELAALVAAVYDARGWEAELVDGDVVTTPPGDDRARRFVVPAPANATGATGAAAGDDVRRVIAAERGGDGATVDADDLRRMVSYALDADDTERLFRRFFDCDPADVAAPSEVDRPADDDAAPGDVEAGGGQDSPTGSGDRTTATGPGTGAVAGRNGGRRGAAGSEGGARADDPDPDGDSSRRTRWLVVGLAVALVGAVVVASGPALTSPGGDVEGDVAGDATATGTGADGTGGDATDAGTTANGTDNDSEPLPAALEPMRAPAVDGPLPPGIEDDRIVDASRLADAHEEGLTGRSFRVRIAYREFVDDELRGVAHERVTVAGPGRYRSDVYTLGRLDHESTTVASESSYGNGTTRFYRTGTGDVATGGVESDRFVDRTERYVRWYLSVEESRIVGTETRGGTTLLRIDLDGDPWPGTSSLRGWALVDREGTVRAIHREYVPTRDPAVRIETTIRITPGEAAVTRPAWVNATRRNGTIDMTYAGLPPSLERPGQAAPATP